MRTHLLSQLLLLTAALVVSVAMIPAAQAQTAKKPNILVIWGDDSQTPGSFNLEGIQKKIQATMGGR